MKKLFVLILAVCLAMLTTVPAFADGRGPAFTNYDVVCTGDTPYFCENWDKDGVMEKKGSFPSGTVLTVDYEYEKDGIVYGDVRIGSEDDWDWVYIRLSDVDLKEDTYLPENAQKLSRERTVRVIERGGIPLYSGPNKKYSKIMTIPRGTKLTYNYGNDEDDYYRTWAYVKYLNKSGWIYVYVNDTKNGLGQLPYPGEEAKIWVLTDDVKLYSGMSFGNIEDEFDDDWITPEYKQELHEEPDRVTGTLEKGKQYKYQYKHSDDYGTWYYVTAGLRAGWAFQSDENGRFAVTVPDDEQDYYMSYKALRLKLYDTPNKKSGAVTVTVPKNTVLHPEYMTNVAGESFFYETIDGKSGWYSRENAWDACAYRIDSGREYYLTSNRSDQAAPIYSDIMQRGKPIGKVPAGSLFTPLYSGGYSVGDPEDDSYEWFDFLYIRYNDVTGWVLDDDMYSPDEDAEEPAEETEEYTEDEWIEEEETYEPDYDYEDEYDEEDISVVDVAPAPVQSGNGAMRIVLTCVAAAVVLALTAIVTLLLIRRKRGAKPAENAAVTEPAETEPKASEPAETAAEDEPPTDET